ncbi:helix-turn-helix transcriptional regulator [Pseudomonas sp. HY7a-MNA-CIBAN-0227]|uniref:response regulator transcription factor n=1 Tax=Pseudomonas sp. HY7a-MNA-CIBAN-0227 TaxID=3140474 RepID=UPI00331D4BC9
MEQVLRITEKERSVALLLAQGLTNKQIGKAMGISDHTVRDHLSSLYRKHGVSNRVSLVAKGITNI